MNITLEASDRTQMPPLNPGHALVTMGAGEYRAMPPVAGVQDSTPKTNAANPLDSQSTESPTPEFDPEALRDLLQSQIEKSYAGNRMLLEPDVQLVADITRTIRKMSRAGTKHVLDAGFGAMIETTSTLILRLQTAFAWHLSRIDQSDGGRNGQQILGLTPEIRDLLPQLTDLGHLLIRLSDAYTKFTHVSSLTKNNRDRSTNE